MCCVPAQRSGQELPQVESFSPASCSVDGGEELLITGSNISTQSRVVFMEKTSGKIHFIQVLSMLNVFSDKFNLFFIPQMEDHCGKWMPELCWKKAAE